MTADTKIKKSMPSATPGIQGRKELATDKGEYTTLAWFEKQGARFVKVAAWNAKVNAPGKQPIESAWQKKPRTLDEVLPHVKNGGNVGMLCGAPSGGLCLLDVDDHLGEFLEYFPGLADAPIIQRRDAPNRGKIVLKLSGEIPANKKWHDHHLEFLGTGNQGVIPPSIHPEGAPYELRNADRSALDYDGARLFKICEAWTNRNAPESNHDLTPPTVGRGRLSRQTRDFLSYGAGPATRNNRLFVAACDLCGCNYPQAEAEALLLPVWFGMGKPEKEARSTITSAYSQARQPANPHAFDHVTASKPAPVAVIEETEDEPNEDESADFPITSNMPELPKVARLDPALEKDAKKAGKFIGDYMAFAMKAAPMTPPLFHQTFALAILSTAIARRVYVRGGTDAIYPNLYILLSARSTLYTKTTGYNAALKVLEAAGLSHLNLPDGMTPQSLMTELSNRAQDNFTSWDKEEQDDWKQERLFAGQRAWWVDEAARLLNQLQQKHLAELGDIMLKLYECPPKIKVSTQMRGRETVRNSYLTICGPTTPAALRPHLKNNMYWGNGLFSRFLLVSPDTAPVRVFYPEPFAMPASLPKHINQLAFDRLESPKESALGPASAPPAIEAKIGSEVRQMWDNYHAAMYELIGKKAVAEKLEPWYGRITTNAIKIAMLLAASDWARMAKGNPLEIHPAHWARAQEFTEGYRASLHRMIEDASLPIESEDDELAEKIIARVKSGIRTSRRELTQDLHVRAGLARQRFDTIISQLIDDGVLIEYEVKKERGPGTKRLFYRNP